MAQPKALKHCAAAGPPMIASQEPYERAWQEWAKETAAARTQSAKRAAQSRLARALARQLTQHSCSPVETPVQQDAASAAAADLLSRFELLSAEREVLLPEAALDFALARDGCDAAALQPGMEALKTAVLEAVQVECARGPADVTSAPTPELLLVVVHGLPLS